MPSLQEQLSKDVANISWQDLLPHAKRDAVIVVAENLNLLDVATAIAEDNTVVVQKWITNKSIFKPSAEQLTTWNQAQKTEFATLIVQPFVIVKEII